MVQEGGDDAGPTAIAHSILSGSEIARLVREHYDLAPLGDCALLRRG